MQLFFQREHEENSGNSLASSIRGQKVKHGLVVYGMAKFQPLKLTFQGLIFPAKSLVWLVRSRIPLKIQALKFQISGAEVWPFHTPPIHTPPFACSSSTENSEIEEAIQRICQGLFKGGG